MSHESVLHVVLLCKDGSQIATKGRCVNGIYAPEILVPKKLEPPSMFAEPPPVTTTTASVRRFRRAEGCAWLYEEELP